MNRIKKYDDFLKEEINLKKALIGGVIATGLAAGSYEISKIDGKANKIETEVLSGLKFNQYAVYTNGNVFNLNFSEDGIISAMWSESEGSGDNRKTVYYNSVTVPNKTNEIWYDTKFFESDNGLFASIAEIKGGDKILLDQLDIIEETETYIIYDTPMFSSINRIIMNKGHKEGEEFKIDGIMGNWVCDDLGNKSFIFVNKDLGGGNFGGSGSGKKY